MSKLLSQLLEEGSNQLQHVRGCMFRLDGKGTEVVGGCAMGMMVVAKAGTKNIDECSRTVREVVNELESIFPDTSVPESLRDLLIEWNDRQWMTVPRIIEKLQALGR